MRGPDRGAVLLALLLLLCQGTAYADGKAVLDEMETSRAELIAVVEDGQDRIGDIEVMLGDADKATRRALKKERKALKKAVKKAAKALESFDVAVPALRRNDVPTFTGEAAKAAKNLTKVEKYGPKITWEGWPLAPDGSERITTALGTSLEEALALIDAGAAGKRAPTQDQLRERAQSNLEKGHALQSKAKHKTAVKKFMAGINDVWDFPTPVGGTHQNIVLRDLRGNPLSLALGVAPYSPKQTCGATGCHDYDTITGGFHFQQGARVIADSFSVNNPDVPNYVLSDGMFGRW